MNSKWFICTERKNFLWVVHPTPTWYLTSDVGRGHFQQKFNAQLVCFNLVSGFSIWPLRVSRRLDQTIMKSLLGYEGVSGHEELLPGAGLTDSLGFSVSWLVPLWRRQSSHMPLLMLHTCQCTDSLKQGNFTKYMLEQSVFCPGKLEVDVHMVPGWAYGTWQVGIQFLVLRYEVQTWTETKHHG